MTKMLLRLAPALVLATIALAELRPETKTAFDRYVQLVEQRMDGDARQGRFLVLGEVKHEEPVTQEYRLKDAHIPNGQVQHWLGSMFIPKATLAQVKSVMQDYGNYKTIYDPDVTDSKLLKREGDDFEIFLRLYKKQILTVVYNTNYKVHYATPAPNRMTIYSRATRIAEVTDSGEKPPGEDRGFLWGLNSYWRFQQASDG